MSISKNNKVLCDITYKSEHLANRVRDAILYAWYYMYNSVFIVPGD